MADGRGRVFVVTLEDVTERREAEARRVADALRSERAARERAEGANRAKTEFLAVLSHELRTPLNAIAGYAELLQLGIPDRLPAAVAQHVARIHENEHHLQALVDSILGFAKLEAGHVEYDIADVLVEDVLRALEGVLAPQLAARGLTLRLDAPPAPTRVRADPDKLGQVLRNLVGNAIKFSDRGEIVVAAAAEGDERLGRVVRFRVRDEGCGIPGEQQEAIFRPFVQLTPRPSARAAGFGLGLAISREYARAMGGDLLVESRVGEGSTFTVVLPGGGGTAG
jgi:signal transduction histidine kinase